jgi:two-component system, OmpR family, osmolarity sensor histidine kinase EnvZ
MRLPRPWPAFLWRMVKRRTPTTLFGRSLLIIVLPVTIMQVAVTYAFFDAHWQAVNAHLTEGVAGDIAWILQAYEETPSAANLAHIQTRAQQTMGLSVALEPGAILPRGRRPVLIVAVDRSLRRAMSERIDAPFWFDTARYPAYVDIRIKVPQGVLRIIAPKDRVFATKGHIFILWLTVATILLTGIALLFIRNQVRAIERLAEAADAFGRGVDLPFRPYGAREVRQAARAFLSMKARIQRHVDQRTTLLAAVSHDLRTPLTRLALELALSEPGERIEEMKRDVAEMEHMIDEYLAFARGEGAESVEIVDVGRLLAEVSEAAERSGAKVSVAAPDGLSAGMRRNAMKRALTNLVMNAASHARTVALSGRPGQMGGAEIIIDDDGPGIPEDRYEEAFAPFGRLDEGRSPNEKGVGLGMAIARDIVRGHGGDVTLARSPLGGLRAVVRAPG